MIDTNPIAPLFRSIPCAFFTNFANPFLYRRLLHQHRLPPLEEPPLGGGWHGSAMTGGESLGFSFLLEIVPICAFFSPSVSFADSSLVRGSHGRSRARKFIDTLGYPVGQLALKPQLPPPPPAFSSTWLPPLEEPPLGGGWHGSAVTGGESLGFSFLLENRSYLHLFLSLSQLR